MKAFTSDIPGTPAQAWDGLVAGLPPLDPPAEITVLAAHADDETLGVGGLISTARAATVIIASDGAASHPDSPTHPPARLARIRRAEAAAAVAALHPHATLRFLDLPDGGLAAAVDTIAAALESTRGCLLSTWLGDGHPDHEACARAARRVAAVQRRRLLEYPIWAWLWADPAGTDLPGHLRRFDLPPRAVAAKRAALACYPSQTGALSDRPGDAAVLPARFLAHFARPAEVVIDNAAAAAGNPSYFEALYARRGDPWELAGRWYERRKRAVLIAALPRERFRRAFEPGCGPGLLSAELRTRAHELVAVDAAAPGAARMRIPADWPAGRFDLIVLSELGYYVADLAALAARIRDSLDADGVLVLCHWRHPAPDHPHDAGTVHAVLGRLTGLTRLVRHEEADFLLDVLAVDPRSVAQREGIVS